MLIQKLENRSRAYVVRKYVYILTLKNKCKNISLLYAEIC